MMVFLFPSIANVEAIGKAVAKYNKSNKEMYDDFKELTVSVGKCGRRDIVYLEKIKNTIDLSKLNELKNKYNMSAMSMSMNGFDFDLTMKFKSVEDAEAAKVYIKTNKLYGVDPL